MTTYARPSKLEFFRLILKDPDRKSLFRISYECIYLLFIYKELPVHYFSRLLFKKEVKNIRDYLPNKFLGNKVTPRFNDKKVKEVLDNKLFFDLFYRQFNINLPTILMYNHNKMFVIANKSVIVGSVQEFIEVLELVFVNNTLCDSIIIKKTCASSGGSNIYKLFQKQLQTDPQTINEIYQIVIRSEFLFQNCVKQHPEMNKLSSSSLNTLRMDTFIDGDGKIYIISGMVRMSTNNTFVDNVSSGGCFVAFDIDNGKLKKYGYTTSGPELLLQHPVTKTVFENFSIPYFSEAKELVIKIAGLMPALRLVGWDVAISEDGPLIIEGNSDYEIRGSDFAYGGYLANKTFRKVLHEIKYL
jgi:hypothetical protein